MKPTSNAPISAAAAASLPARPTYDVRLERMDTAIRAVIKVSVGNWSNWAQAEMLGLSKAQHASRLLAALEQCDDLRNEESLFALVKRCPFLVDAAQLLLGLYQTATYDTREAYHHSRSSRLGYDHTTTRTPQNPPQRTPR